jgi:MoaA/NifB/PqqE/SkfB family radical SAM enzyme
MMVRLTIVDFLTILPCKEVSFYCIFCCWVTSRIFLLLTRSLRRGYETRCQCSREVITGSPYEHRGREGEVLALAKRCEQLCRERDITFKAAGSATPAESLIRDFGERPWSGCRRPYTLTYITSSGNVLSCCFVPFGHKSAREYKEERVLGNIFEESIESIWHGERYQAFRRAFESDHPARHCSQCGLNWSY